MSNYKRAAFNKDWWAKISDFLQDNPQIGFEESEQKQFIKWLVNTFIENNQVVMPEHKFKEILRKSGADKTAFEALNDED